MKVELGGNRMYGDEDDGWGVVTGVLCSTTRGAGVFSAEDDASL